jgi:hypothetical protein
MPPLLSTSSPYNVIVTNKLRSHLGFSSLLQDRTAQQEMLEDDDTEIEHLDINVLICVRNSGERLLWSWSDKSVVLGHALYPFEHVQGPEADLGTSQSLMSVLMPLFKHTKNGGHAIIATAAVSG